MKSLTSLNFEDENILSCLEDEILVFKIKQSAFEIGCDLGESSYIFEILDLAEKSADVKAVFFYNNPGCFGNHEYENFLRNIFQVKDEDKQINFARIADESMRMRQINILNHLIYHIITLKKIVVLGLQGNVVTPFIGVSLAADLRFATMDMEFSFAHLKYGLHPTGAVPYFLPKYIGLSRAKYLLFRGGKISAEEALGLNIIHKIFDPAHFKESCLAEVKEIIQHDIETLSITKKLFNINPQELQKYFEFETQKTILK